MKLQKQRPHECKLATLAMLAEVPLDEVRLLSCQIAKVDNWAEVLKNPNLFFATIEKLQKHYRISRIITGKKISGGQQLKRYFPATVEDLKLKGKGELLISWIDQRAHSVAYENNTIYDSTLEAPMPLQRWLKSFEDCWEQLIIVEERNNGNYNDL